MLCTDKYYPCHTSMYCSWKSQNITVIYRRQFSIHLPLFCRFKASISPCNFSRVSLCSFCKKSIFLRSEWTRVSISLWNKFDSSNQAGYVSLPRCVINHVLPKKLANTCCDTDGIREEGCLVFRNWTLLSHWNV